MTSSAEWLARDHDVLAPVSGRLTDIVAVRGEGSWLVDADGDRWLDFTSGIAVTNVGHCNPRVVAAIQEQAATLIHTSVVTHHTKAVELAEKLASLVPYLENPQVFFCNTGAEAVEARLAYYKHIAEEPHPTITVIEDLDATPGFGAWWGEVNTHVHRGLGSLGAITNGSIRDLDEAAKNFQLLAGCVGPSHAFVHVVESAVTVTVAGMVVRPGDLIHADRHGAVVIPIEAAPRIPEAAERIVREESVMITASRKPDFSFEVMKELMTGGRGSGH